MHIEIHIEIHTEIHIDNSHTYSYQIILKFTDILLEMHIDIQQIIHIEIHVEIHV